MTVSKLTDQIVENLAIEDCEYYKQGPDLIRVEMDDHDIFLIVVKKIPPPKI